MHEEAEELFPVSGALHLLAVGLGPFERLNEHQRALFQTHDLFSEHAEDFADPKRRLQSVDRRLINAAAVLRGRCHMILPADRRPDAVIGSPDRRLPSR